MFRKPLPLTGTHKLGGTDQKKLRKALEKRFGATPEDAEALIPKKSELTLAKCAAPSRLQLYLVDGQPVLYDPSGKGDYELTVFALWRVPHLMGEPVAVRHPAVTRYLTGGADLMLPGVGSLPAQPFGSGKRLAIVVPGNPAPFAIGETEMSSAGVADARGKGKFLRVVTCYRDALWDVAASHPARPPLSPNEGYLEDGVVPVGAAGIDDLDEEEDTDEEGADEGADHEEDEGADARADVDVDVDDDGVLARRAETLSVSEDAPSASAPISASAPPSAPSTPEEMDALIDRSMLQALRSSVKDKSLPLLSTAFWSLHVAPSRPEGSTLDVKAGTHRKMSKLIQSKAALGWFTAKEDKRTKEMMLTSVNRAHPDLLAHRSHATAAAAAETAETEKAARAAATPSFYKGAAAAAAAGDGPPPPLILEETLRPPTCAAAIFAALDPAEYPFENATYSPAEAKAAVAAYAAAKGLDRGAPSKAHVVLDPQLCDALFKGVLKKGDAYPTHCLRSDVANAWLARWRPETRVSRGGRESVKKGALTPIKVESDRRGGDRRVTRVWGYETYFIDPEELRETLGAKLATACAVGEVEGAKNAKLREVTAAGNAVEKVVKILTEHYGVPAKLIAAKDKFAGKGKNR